MFGKNVSLILKAMFDVYCGDVREPIKFEVYSPLCHIGHIRHIAKGKTATHTSERAAAFYE